MFLILDWIEKKCGLPVFEKAVLSTNNKMTVYFYMAQMFLYFAIFRKLLLFTPR